MSIDYSVEIYCGYPVKYELVESINAATSYAFEEYFTCIDCYCDNENSTYIFGIPVMSIEMGEFCELPKEEDCAEERAKLYEVYCRVPDALKEYIGLDAPRLYLVGRVS